MNRYVRFRRAKRAAPRRRCRPGLQPREDPVDPATVAGRRYLLRHDRGGRGGGGADPAALVALVRDQRVDLLALQEFTPEAERALDGAGLAALLPQRVSDPQPGVAGSALYSRFPLHNDGVRLNTLDFQQARGTVSVPGAAPLEVESVHTCSPYSAANTRCWQRSFRNEP